MNTLKLKCEVLFPESAFPEARGVAVRETPRMCSAGYYESKTAPSIELETGKNQQVRRLLLTRPLREDEVIILESHRGLHRDYLVDEYDNWTDESEMPDDVAKNIGAFDELMKSLEKEGVFRKVGEGND